MTEKLRPAKLVWNHQMNKREFDRKYLKKKKKEFNQHDNKTKA